MKSVLIAILLGMVLWTPVVAETDQVVRTLGNSNEAGVRNAFDLANGMYIATGRGSSGASIPLVVMRGTANGATWTKDSDTTMIPGNTQNVQVTVIADTAYFAAGADGITPRVGKYFYNGSTTRDTMLPCDTIQASPSAAAPQGMAFNYRNDTIITFVDDTNGVRLKAAKTPTRFAAGMGAWTVMSPYRVLATTGGYVTFASGRPAGNIVACFTVTNQDLYVSDGTTIDSVVGGANLLSVENNQASNVSFVARSITDSVISVIWELNDSLLLRLGCFTGATYPYGWSWLTAAVRVDSRISPTGDGTPGIKEEGRVAMLGNVLYSVYKDFRNTANIDSVDICERHIDLTTVPANLSGLTGETILRHAIDGFLVVDMMTPEWYNTSRSLVWEMWRDNAAAGSRVIYAHIDTVSAAPSAGNFTVQRSGVQQGGVMVGR